MNQQNQRSGTPLNVPVKRKRGRPRKDFSAVQGENVPRRDFSAVQGENVPRRDFSAVQGENVPRRDFSAVQGENVPRRDFSAVQGENVPRRDFSAVQGENVPVIPGSYNVLNFGQTAGTTDDSRDEMVGKSVTGFIEGTFNAGYLLNVKVENTDAVLRGLVFEPGQVSPVTVENDVAPHIKMIKRKEMAIPVLNPQPEIHGSVSPSVQCNKQPFEPKLQVLVSEERVPPTEIPSSISEVPGSQSASTLIPTSISISSGGIPQWTSEPGHVNRSTSIMPELDRDKMIKQGETLPQLDASTQVKASNADGRETKDSEAASDFINLVPSIGNTNTELRTGQQVVPSVHQLNRGASNISNIEFNLIPLSTEPKALPSAHTSETVNYFEEKRESPKTDVPEDTKKKLENETLSNVGTSNSTGRPSTDVNIPVVGSNQALEASQPESMPSEQTGRT